MDTHLDPEFFRESAEAVYSFCVSGVSAAAHQDKFCGCGATFSVFREAL